MRLRLEWPLHVVRRVAIGAVVLAVLAVAVPLTVDWIGDRRARCDDGVVKRDGECVGVTDGSWLYAGHLQRVEDLIKEENDRVLKDHKKSNEPYVSVAYMTSFTLTEDVDSNSEDSVRHELEGAYTAQVRHNRGDLEASPKIRLLIANTGSSSAHWEHTVGELIKRKDSGDRLVAVTGLGPSTGPNVKALKRLSGNGIATVASTMSATNIRDIKGFVRVGPTNVDEAYAASNYLKQKTNFHKAVVVQDIAHRNPYATTLADAFTRTFPHKARGYKLVGESMTFDSSGSPGVWKNELRNIPVGVCVKKPEVIFFAGRGQHLTRFLNSLANRDCTDQEFTVIAGDDTSNLDRNEIRHAAKKAVSVFYTGLAHREMWREMWDADPKRVSEGSGEYFREGGLMDEWFSDDDRYDGQELMGHDAVVTAAHSIRLAADGDETTGEAVGQMFHQMDGQPAPGASGFLTFGHDGNPQGRPVPILRLDDRGRSHLEEISAPRPESP